MIQYLRSDYTSFYPPIQKVVMMKIDENSYELIVSITRNCRLNIRNISRELGVNYVTIKKKISRLLSNGLFSIKPMIPAKLAGLTAGLVRVKNPPYWLFRFLSSCNRVLAYINMEGETVFLIYGRDKQEVVDLINRIMECNDELLEFTIEFGKLPLTQLIPIKNIEQDNGICNSYCNCGFCIIGNGYIKGKK
ncbi:MAG: hypothetical protein QXT03_04945 [Desulfurococcaceae archaeon]